MGNLRGIFLSCWLNLIEDWKIRKTLFHSIRNRSLLELGVLYFCFFADEPGPTIKLITTRLQKKRFPNKANIAFELKPSDVKPILGCSDRKARELIQTLKILMS